MSQGGHGRDRVVDVHAHFAPLTSGTPLGADPFIDRSGASAVVQLHGHPIDSIVREVGDPGLLLEQESAIGIDVVILSPWVALLPQHEEPGPAEAMCQRLNEAMARTVGDDPRLAGMAAVPMIDPRRAIRVLKEALESGLSGVEIVPTVGGAFVGDDRFEPFFAAAAEMGAPVFIHPSSRGMGIDALRGGYLWNAVGNPVETAVVAAQLVLNGLLERYPNLHIVLAHAGGVLPAVFGRVDHAYAVRPEPRARLSEPPSRSFARLYYDTIAHGRRELVSLLEAVGPAQLLFGTDHPFDMGDYAQRSMLESLGLTPGDLDAILGGTAARLFGLSSSSNDRGEASGKGKEKG